MITNTYLLNASLLFLIPVAILSAYDGIYLHLFKYKLQENPDSKLEHLTHTIRSLLFIPIVLLLLIWNVSGTLLYLLISLLVIDFVVEILDLIEEKRSRKKMGGLPHLEYILHMTLTTARVATFSLVIASKPIEAFFGNMVLPKNPDLVIFAGEQMIYGAVFISLLHITLILRPKLITETLNALKKM